MPAKMVAIQKVHLHPMVSEQNPEIMGAMSGPNTVATMKNDNALPLDLGSPNMSANIPPEMTMQAEAEMPANSRNTKNAGKFGANAQAIVKRVKRKKVPRVISRRPYCSEAGAQNMGPKYRSAYVVQNSEVCPTHNISCRRRRLV
jgi:hypothetical protein